VAVQRILQSRPQPEVTTGPPPVPPAKGNSAAPAPSPPLILQPAQTPKWPPPNPIFLAAIKYSLDWHPPPRSKSVLKFKLTKLAAQTNLEILESYNYDLQPRILLEDAPTCRFAPRQQVSPHHQSSSRTTGPPSLAASQEDTDAQRPPPGGTEREGTPPPGPHQSHQVSQPQVRYQGRPLALVNLREGRRERLAADATNFCSPTPSWGSRGPSWHREPRLYRRFWPLAPQRPADPRSVVQFWLPSVGEQPSD